MLGLALALALAAQPAEDGRLPPPDRKLYQIAWHRDLAGKTLGEWRPEELGGVARDPVTRLVVAGTRDGWLHALREDGSLAWEFQGGAAFAGQPLIDGDTVYAGCNDGRLYALALATGKERWRYESKEQLGTRPAILDGTVYVASLQDTLYAVDARTGAWKWHYRREVGEGFTVEGAASVAAADGLVHAGFSDGSLVAFDAGTGAVRWERHAAPRGDYTDVDSLVLSGGKLYAAAFSGAVVALEAASGKPLWQFEVPEASRVAMVAPGLLLAVTTRSVLALSPLDGHRLWSTPLQGSPSGVPCVAGRWLLVPAGHGGLRILELASGRAMGVLDTGTGVSASLALAGDHAWLLSNGGWLLALRFE